MVSVFAVEKAIFFFLVRNIFISSCSYKTQLVTIFKYYIKSFLTQNETSERQQGEEKFSSLSGSILLLQAEEQE